MRLMNLNEQLVDPNLISFIGLPDKHIKHDIKAAVTTHFFLIVVDGHPIEVKANTEQLLLNLRQKLIDELSKVEGYMPG